MKFRFLLISLSIVALTATVWFTTDNCGEGIENAYIPRSEFHSSQGIEGAWEYYKSIRSNVYTGEIEPEDIIGMRRSVREMDKNHLSAKNDDISWAAMGPDNVGGRTRAILPFPNDVNTLIAGCVSGGLFKSTNGGQSWSRLTNFDQNLIVGSIAMLGNGAIYVGTGHSRESGTPSGTENSNFIGGGLFVSNDQGSTWNLVNDFEPNMFSPSDAWAYTNSLAGDPNDPDKLWIGSNFGLYPFTHGDTELGPLPQGLNIAPVGDLAISADGQNLIVAVGPRVYVSTDAGATFELRNSDAPFGLSGNSTIDLSISADDKNFMAASVASGSGNLKAIYATKNAGLTWYVIAPASSGSSSQFDPFTGQGNYDNMITIVPGTNANNAQEIIMGGSASNYRYTLPPNTVPGIFTWEVISEGYVSAPGSPPSSAYVHPDMHTSAWDANNRLYIGSDGGIFRSNDKGLSWNDLNRNYVTTQFYAIAFSPSGQVMGGTQDNGTLFVTLNGATPQQAVQFTGGDGFSCEISQVIPDFMFSTIYNGAVYRSATGGGNVTEVGDLSTVGSGGGNDFFTDISLYENENNEYSEQYVHYTPSGDDPYVNFFGDGQYEVTAAGDTIIGKIPAGTQIVTDADNSDLMVTTVLDEDINFYSYYVRIIGGDSVILHEVADTTVIQEKGQFMLAAAFSNGIYVTRQPLKTNGTPHWFKIHQGESSNPSCVEWSPDGDILYVGYDSGQLIRYKGFNSAWGPLQLNYQDPAFALDRKVIHNGQGVITDIDVDYSQGQGTTIGQPASSERVAITEGNYGGFGKVRVSDTAASADGAGSFQNIWNVDDAIRGMPCYSIVMDVNDPNVFLVGTEYGIYYSGDNGATWSVANNGAMNRVPIFDLRQQKRPNYKVNNSGVVYAGSHGRGIFRTDYLLNESTGIEGVESEIPALSELTIYPNPVRENGSIRFDLGTNDAVSMKIYSLDGRLVRSIAPKQMESGRKKELTFNASELATGTYIVMLKAGEAVKTGKFIKTN